jgi:hypothetical protein
MKRVRQLAALLLLSAISNPASASGLDSTNNDGGAGAAAAKPTLKFDNERYALSFVDERGDGTINEYLRSGETSAAWNQMVTVSESRNSFDLTEFMKSYVTRIKSTLAMAPEVMRRWL